MILDQVSTPSRCSTSGFLARCDCRDNTHFLELWWFDVASPDNSACSCEFYLTLSLPSGLSFWRRLTTAILYLFKRTDVTDGVGEIVLSMEDLALLAERFQKAAEVSLKKHEACKT